MRKTSFSILFQVFHLYIVRFRHLSARGHGMIQFHYRSSILSLFVMSLISLHTRLANDVSVEPSMPSLPTNPPLHKVNPLVLQINQHQCRSFGSASCSYWSSDKCQTISSNTLGQRQLPQGTSPSASQPHPNCLIWGKVGLLAIDSFHHMDLATMDVIPLNA